MHKTVLLQETIDSLVINKGGAYIDLTVGAGGHSEGILSRLGETGRLLAVDQDASALKIAQERLRDERVTFAKSNFADISEVAIENDFSALDGIIADLGVSSMQLDRGERGFSFNKPADLDMRMDQEQGLTAADVVNNYKEAELIRILREYGGEEFAKKIAKEIVLTREKQLIIRTDQLAEVVRRVKKTKTKIDPATKTFQALRIEVNKELSVLESVLPQMVRLLKPGGRMAIISFHSLEDRIVKSFIERESRRCVCPPEFPKCVCDTKPTLKKITKKAVVASEKEIAENPRSRSARLRVAERL